MVVEVLGITEMQVVVELVRFQRGSQVNWPATLVWCVALPLLSCALVLGLRPTSLGMQALTTLILITPMGPLLYRLAYRPLADATVRVHDRLVQQLMVSSRRQFPPSWRCRRRDRRSAHRRQARNHPKAPAARRP